MKTIFVLFVCFFLHCSLLAAGDVLIVADEIPAMDALAGKLKTEERIAAKVVTQTNMPSNLSAFSAVVVYVHMGLSEPAEKAFIAYTQEGGKLIVLHHSISSMKRRNAEWFKFLGVSLPEGSLDQGGYKYTEGISMDIVNLAPDQFITTNKVAYPERIAFRAVDSSQEKMLPAVTLEDSEVYLNHVLIGPRTVLLGVKFTDAQSGNVYMQSHAGWVKPSGKGWIIYLMPGHSVRDLENPTYQRILLNAVIWKP